MAPSSFLATLLLGFAAGASPDGGTGTATDGGALSAPEPLEKQRFLGLLEQGEGAFASGQFDDANLRFREADALLPTPEVAFNLAKVQEKRGRQAEELFFYRLYLRRAPSAEDGTEVRKRIAALLADASARGRGLLELEAETGQTPLSVRLGGDPLGELPTAALLPPGDFEVSVTFASGVSTRFVSVKTGEISTWVAAAPKAAVAELHAETPGVPAAEAAKAPAAPAAALSEVPTGKTSIARGASVALLAASGVALLAGSAFGLMARSDREALGAGRGTLTVAEGRALRTQAEGRGGLANTLWIGGGAGALAAGVLFFASSPEGE